MTDLRTVLSDPDFNALPAAEREKVLQEIDPNFTALPQTERMKVMAQLDADVQSPTAPPLSSPSSHEIGDAALHAPNALTQAGKFIGDVGDRYLADTDTGMGMLKGAGGIARRIADAGGASMLGIGGAGSGRDIESIIRGLSGGAPPVPGEMEPQGPKEETGADIAKLATYMGASGGAGAALGPGAGVLTQALGQGAAGASAAAATGDNPVVGGTLGAAGPVAGKALSGVASLGSASLRKAAETILRPNSKSYRYGKDPVRGLTELGLPLEGTRKELATKVSSAIGAKMTELEGLVKGAKTARVDMRAEVSAALGEFTDKVTKKIGDPSVSTAASEFAERLIARTEQIAGRATRVKLPVVLKLKRDIQSGSKYSGAGTPLPAINEFRQMVAARLGRVIEGHLPDTAPLNQSISDLIEAKALLLAKRRGSPMLSVAGARAATLDSVPAMSGVGKLSSGVSRTASAARPAAQQMPAIAEILRALGMSDDPETR